MIVSIQIRRRPTEDVSKILDSLNTAMAHCGYLPKARGLESRTFWFEGLAADGPFVSEEVVYVPKGSK